METTVVRHRDVSNCMIANLSVCVRVCVIGGQTPSYTDANKVQKNHQFQAFDLNVYYTDTHTHIEFQYETALKGKQKFL